MEIFLSQNYGAHLGFQDNEYEKLGVKILKDEIEILKTADIIVQLSLLSDDKKEILKENQTLIGILNPFNNKENIDYLIKKKINFFSL